MFTIEHINSYRLVVNTCGLAENDKAAAGLGEHQQVDLHGGLILDVDEVSKKCA